MSPLTDAQKIKKQEFIDIKSDIISNYSDVERNRRTIKNIENATNYYKIRFGQLHSESAEIARKNSLSNRIAQFYSQDYDVKKSLLYYLNIIYILFVVLFVILVIYKKKHREKKMYVFLFLLVFIPYYFIKKMYVVVLNTLGHISVDILYATFIVLTALLSYGLFAASKYTLKTSGYKNTMINSAASLSSSLY